MPVLHLIGIPAVRVKAGGVTPDVRIVVQMVQGADNDGFFRQLVAAGEDHVDSGGAARLVGRVVAALCLLDQLVHEGETISELGSDLRVLVDVIVDELLEQTLLDSRVGDDAVDQPGQKGAGGGKAGTRGDE